MLLHKSKIEISVMHNNACYELRIGNGHNYMIYITIVGTILYIASS